MWTTFNKIMEFKGQYVAQQIEVTESKHPLLNIDVTSLDALDSINDTDLALPAEARLGRSGYQRS
jgi:hypothetical protein